MILKNSKTNEVIDLSEYGFHVHSKQLQMTPDITPYDSDVIFGVTKRVSTETTGRPIEVRLAVNTASLTELNDKISFLNKLFRKKSYELSFKTNPEIYYKDVHIRSAITAEQITTLAYILTLQLYSYDGNAYDGTRFEETITVSGNNLIELESNGVSTTYPFLKISGFYQNVKFTMEGKTMNLTGGDGFTIYVDNKNMLIYSLNYENNKVNELRRWTGSFLSMEEEMAQMFISVTGGEATIEVSYDIPKY